MHRFPDHAPQYGALDTYRLAAEWLDGHGTVCDWGCGKGFSRQFFVQSEWVGIDGTFNGEGNVNLADFKLPCDSILMRHVLEHNPDDWRQILKNACESFQQRMALVTFTPFADRTHVYKVEKYASGELPYLRFARADLLEVIGDLLICEQPVLTTHEEHIFLLERAMFQRL
jgi:hypothetical protein